MKIMQANVLNNLAVSNRAKTLKELAFRGLILNTQSKLIGKLEKAKGEEIYKIRIFRRIFTAWKTITDNTKSEHYRLELIKEKLNYKKKLVIMRKWKENILSTQVRRAQLYTALYVNKKNLMKKAFQSLNIYSSALKYEKCRWNTAVRFEKVKLLTTGFKMLQWYKNKKKSIYQMNLRVEAAYDRLAKRRGFNIFIKNCRESTKQKQLHSSAVKFHNHKLEEKYFEIFKHFTLIQKGLKDQEY